MRVWVRFAHFGGGGTLWNIVEGWGARGGWLGIGLRERRCGWKGGTRIGRIAVRERLWRKMMVVMRGPLSWTVTSGYSNKYRTIVKGEILVLSCWAGRQSLRRCL